MDSRNERARRFYTKLGFAEIDRVEAPELTTVYFGKKLEKQS